MAVPYTFATATSAIPLSQLDSNFATAITLGSTSLTLGTTTTTIAGLTLTSPTLTTPALGTPSSGVLTNCTGYPSSAISGTISLTTQVTGTLPVANGGTGVTTSTGSGSNVLSTSPTLVTPILGTPTSVTLTNATGLPIATGVSGLGTGVATALAVNTGSAGAFLVNGGALGTPSSGTLTNATGLPLTTGVTGTLPVANGGTNLTSFTANGVVYASSTSALTTGSALVFTGTNLGIGTTSPNAKLDILATTNTIRLGRSTSSYATIDSNSSAGSLSLSADVGNTGGGGSMTFNIAGTEAMRIDSANNLLVGTTSGTTHQIDKNIQNDYSINFRNTATANTYGITSKFPNASPNGAGNQFLVCGDSSANRLIIYSNGGIANYSANNVNLSDRREKTNFAPSKSYLNVICAIPVQTFNYVDQNRETDDGLTLGVVAQDVQAVAPELVMESNWADKDQEPKIRLSIYQTDLQYALMKCIQELSAQVTTLTTRLTELENK